MMVAHTVFSFSVASAALPMTVCNVRRDRLWLVTSFEYLFGGEAISLSSWVISRFSFNVVCDVHQLRA